MKHRIEKDEYEILAFFVSKEIKSYRKQFAWYNKYKPDNNAVIKDTENYIERLNLLKSKLDAQQKGGVQ